MACIYPDARTPGELWENVMAQRRAFRRLPAERLRTEDYFSSDRNAPDRTYSLEAAVIEGFEFDRVAFRVAGSTFRSADLAHWLALDVAAKALADAGFAEGKNLPRETTGVLLGNTLTGEFSRANGLRLRWPYVRRVVEAELAKGRLVGGKSPRRFSTVWRQNTNPRSRPLAKKHWLADSEHHRRADLQSFRPQRWRLHRGWCLRLLPPGSGQRLFRAHHRRS